MMPNLAKLLNNNNKYTQQAKINLLINLMNDNKEIAFKTIKSHSHIITLITPSVLSRVEKEIDKTYAASLVKLPELAKHLIYDKKSFQVVMKELSFNLASTLLEHKDVAKFAGPITLNTLIFSDIVASHSLKNKARQKYFLGRNPLDLVYPEKPKTTVPEKKSSTSATELELDLAGPSKKELIQYLARTFFSTKSYIEHAMYHKTQGFYSSGKVGFSTDFDTWASKPIEVTALAAAFANQLFYTRAHLIKTKTLDPTHAFKVLECGGGEGTLAKTILSIIQKRGEKDPEWQALFSTIKYHMLEISPALVIKQKAATQEFKQVEVHQGDARKKLNAIFPNNDVAAVVSNELFDMFPTHETVMDSRGYLRAALVINYTTKRAFEKYLLKSGLTLAYLETESDKYAKILLSTDPNLSATFKDKILLSSQSFLKLQEYDKQKLLGEAFGSALVLTSASDIDPEFPNFIRRNPAFWDKIANYMCHPETDVYTVFQNISEILLSGGEVITVDYGNDNDNMSYYIKTFRNGQVGDHYSQFFAGQDITHNVNITLLTQEGMHANLRPRFFGKQESMRIDSFTDEIVPAVSKKVFTTEGSKSNFHVLLQRKEDKEDKEDKLTKSDLSQRFIGKSLPVTQSELFNHRYKGFKAHVLLLKEMTQLSQGKPEHAKLLETIAQRDYALALRKVCASGLDLQMDALLKYKNALEIDVNAPSSDGKTAYDWVEQTKFKMDPLIKEKMLSELTKHGAGRGWTSPGLKM
ncbi:MAG: SAM-dependent methyltransferase [Gammaproteobacteria bacterium]